MEIRPKWPGDNLAVYEIQKLDVSLLWEEITNVTDVTYQSSRLLQKFIEEAQRESALVLRAASAIDPGRHLVDFK